MTGMLMINQERSNSIPNYEAMLNKSWQSYYWKACSQKLTSASNKYFVCLLWKKTRAQRTIIYMIPNHLHYIVIQELLLKISLDCISSFAPLLKDYNTTTRRYHCQDYLQQEGDMMQIIKNHLWTYIISVKISTVDSIHHTGCNIKITKTNAKNIFLADTSQNNNFNPCNKNYTNSN